MQSHSQQILKIQLFHLCYHMANKDYNALCTNGVKFCNNAIIHHSYKVGGGVGLVLRFILQVY